MGRRRRDEHRPAEKWIGKVRVFRHLERMACIFFILTLVLTVPVAGWGTPDADGKCIFNVDDPGTWVAPHKFVDYPQKNCEFSAKLDPNVIVGYENEGSKPGLYYEDPHAYLIENAIRLFREKGWDNWAAYLSKKDNFQALADGVTYADVHKGYVYAKITCFGIDVHSWDICPYAGFYQFYNNYENDPAGKGLDSEDLDVIANNIFDIFNPLGYPINKLLKYLGAGKAIEIVACNVGLHPELQSQYPSGAVEAQEHFDRALGDYTNYPLDPAGKSTLYWPDHSAKYNSFFQLGWALHNIQDIGVIYHLGDFLSSILSPHNPFEEDAKGMGDPYGNESKDFHVNASDWTKLGLDYNEKNIMDLAQEEGKEIYNDGDWELALSKDEATRKPAVQRGVKVSEQFTAAVLAKYLTSLGIPKTTEPFMGRVVDFTGQFGPTPIANAFVFYRQKRICSPPSPDAPQQCGLYIGDWDYVRTGQNGEFVLNLSKGWKHYLDTYQLRPEMPGYQYKGVVQAPKDKAELMNAVWDGEPLDYTPPIAGNQMSSAYYHFFLAPQTGGLCSRIQCVQQPPPGVAALGGNPRFAQSAQWLLPDGTSGALSSDVTYIVSPAKRTALQQAIMEVQVDHKVIVVPLQDAQDRQLIPLPQESSVEISLSHLLDLNTGQTLTSSSAIVSTIKTAINQRALMNTAQSGNTFSNTLQSADTLSKQGVQKKIPPPSQGIKINEPVFSSENWQKVLDALPKIEMKDANGNTVLVPDISNALGSESYSGGESLYHNDMVRAPSPGAEIEVILASGPGYIGPDFLAEYPLFSLNGMVRVVTNLGDQIYNGVLNIANNIISPLTSKGTHPPVSSPQNISAVHPINQGIGTSNLQEISPTVQSIILTTDSEGKAAFKLKTGSQAGIIRVFITVKNDPAAPDIKPRESLEFIVQPPIYEKDTDEIIPPTIEVVPPHHPVAMEGVTFKKAGSEKSSSFCIKITASGETNIVPCPTGDSPQGIQNGTPCNDGNQCTVNDYYQNGVCIGGQVNSCNDGNPDTADTCDPNSGCVFTPIGRGPADGTPCNDGNQCTVNDYYQNGVCMGGQVNSCDDGNPDTADTCDQNNGACVHVSTGGGQTCPEPFTCMYESEAQAQFGTFVRYSDTPCYIDYPTSPVRGKLYKYCYRQGTRRVMKTG